MRVLLDTHVWLWSIGSPRRLNVRCRRLLADGANTVYLSAVSAWEIALKHALGKLALPSPPAEFVPVRIARDGLTALPVSIVHALRVASLPAHHRDPFDRLLVAQAQIENLPILTADPRLEAYDVDIVRAA